MSLLEYGLFWLSIVVLFEWMYGRHFRALARTLLAPDDSENTDCHTVLERLNDFLAKLWEVWKR